MIIDVIEMKWLLFFGTFSRTQLVARINFTFFEKIVLLEEIYFEIPVGWRK